MFQAPLRLFLQHSFQLLSSSLCEEQKAFMKLQQQFINSHMINSGLCWVQENSASPQRILLLIRSWKGPEECFPVWQLSADQFPPAQAWCISLLGSPVPAVVPGLARMWSKEENPHATGRGVSPCGHIGSPSEPAEHPTPRASCHSQRLLQPGPPEEPAVPP